MRDGINDAPTVPVFPLKRRNLLLHALKWAWLCHSLWSVNSGGSDDVWCLGKSQEDWHIPLSSLAALRGPWGEIWMLSSGMREHTVYYWLWDVWMRSSGVTEPFPPPENYLWKSVPRPDEQNPLVEPSLNCHLQKCEQIKGYCLIPLICGLPLPLPKIDEWNKREIIHL